MLIGDVARLSEHLQVFRDRLATLIAKWKGTTTCNAGGLCEIISSADLPSDLTTTRAAAVPE